MNSRVKRFIGQAQRNWLPWVSIMLGLALWEIVGRLLPRILFAPFSATIAELFSGFTSFDLPIAIAASVLETFAGFALATLVALPLGFLLGRNRTCSRIADPLLVALYAIPPVALIPFLIIWFGLFIESRIALIFVMTFFEMLVITAGGARSIEPRLLDVGRSFNASFNQRFCKVLLPASLPFLFTALRVGLVRAIAGMITSQLLLSPEYLGTRLLDSASKFDTAGVLAVITIVALLGLAMQTLLVRIEKRVLHWERDLS